MTVKDSVRARVWARVWEALAVLLLVAGTATAETVVECNGTDATAALQSAINEGGLVTLTAGTCVVSSLDLTLRQGVTIAGESLTATVILGSGPVVLDLSGSSHMTLRDLRVTTGTQCATVGLLLGQTTAGYTSDVIHLHRIRVDGCYGVATMADFGVASSSVVGSAFYNYQAGGIALIQSGRNIFGVSSPYVTLVEGFMPSDWTFMQAELHSFGDGWAWWVGGGTSLRWFGGNISSGRQEGVISLNAVAFEGALFKPRKLILDGTTLNGDEVSGALPSRGVSGMTGAVTCRANDTPIPILGC